MKRLARGKFWWPKINKDIEDIYTNCKPCRSESIAKLQKTCKIRPPLLDSLAPGQVIHLDYLEYDSKHIFILKDQYSGWSKYYLTPDMTSQSAIKSLRDYFNVFWLPTKVVSDSGPSFRRGLFRRIPRLTSHYPPSKKFTQKFISRTGRKRGTFFEGCIFESYWSYQQRTSRHNNL